MVLDNSIIQKCIKNDREAQRMMYDFLASKLYYTCKRYLKKEEEIEEALADSFYIIFTKLHQLKEYLALEAWAKKITVNQCLLYCKKNTNFNLYLEENHINALTDESVFDNIEHEDLLQFLNYLPQGCKTIFNLFVIEGFSHKEISKLLNVSEGTSKSQVNFAKNKLKNIINQHYFQKTK